MGCARLHTWWRRRPGSPVGQAVGMLETARRLETLPTTAEAVRRGELSETKVKEVARAACADDRRESELLEVARTGTVRALRERCQTTVARSGTGEEERARRIRRHRYVRSWPHPEGGTVIQTRMPTEEAAEVLAGIRSFRSGIFERARTEGRREPREAYDADALLEMARASQGGGGGRDGRRSRRMRTQVVVHVSHSALLRGWAEGDERSEVPGLGPVPVSVVEDMMRDSILRVVVENGTDVLAVATRRRGPDTPQRVALEAREETCAVPGCDVREGLEADHRPGLLPGRHDLASQPGPAVPASPPAQDHQGLEARGEARCVAVGGAGSAGSVTDWPGSAAAGSCARAGPLR